MTHIEYGPEGYVAGKHVPDCPSRLIAHEIPVYDEDTGDLTLTVTVCTGCLPIEPT